MLVCWRLCVVSTSSSLVSNPTDTLQKQKTAEKGRAKKLAKTADEIPADEYEVEAILDSGIDKETMQQMYRVKWKGYPEGQATWENRLALEHCMELVREFDKKAKRTPGRRGRKPASEKTNAASPGKIPKKVGRPKAKVTKAVAARKAVPAKKAAASPKKPAGRPPRKTVSTNPRSLRSSRATKA